MRKLTAEKTKEALKSIGLNIENYKRGPLGQYNVSLAKTPSGNGLRVWFPENSEFLISTDKKHRQAVLVVTEPARKVPNKSKRWISPLSLQYEKFNKLKLDNGTIDLQEALQAFPPGENRSVYIPKSTFVPTSARRLDRTIVYSGYSRTQRTTTCFLLGVDEQKHFISVLKKKVSTVIEAHRALRPANVTDRSVRQGEWFFEPVLSDKDAWNIVAFGDLRRNQPLEFGSSHRATVIHYRGARYALGPVRDTRAGYHKKLNLARPHLVVRNGEKKMVAKVRNYD